MGYEIPVQCSPSEIIVQIAEKLRAAGFRVDQSFNLQLASQMNANCKCPYHGTSNCTCQVTVLLVYDAARNPPLTLLIHGYESQCLILILDNPATNPDLQANVLESLFQLDFAPETDMA